MNKPRAIRAYDKLDEALLEQIKLFYPSGFSRHLIRFTDANGRLASVLPFETEDKYYLIKMTKSEAVEIIQEDDDYGEDGELTDEARERYEDDEDELIPADIDPGEIEEEEDEEEDEND